MNIISAHWSKLPVDEWGGPVWQQSSEDLYLWTNGYDNENSHLYNMLPVDEQFMTENCAV